MLFRLVLTLGSGCDSDKEEKSQKKVEKSTEKKPEKQDAEEALTLEEIDRQRRAKALEYSFDRAGRRDPFQPHCHGFRPISWENPEKKPVIPIL